MDNARDIAKSYGRTLKRMRKVSDKTKYETANSICKLEGEDYNTLVAVGQERKVEEPSCGLGKKTASVHTHEKSPPSSIDLRKSIDENYTSCILIQNREVDNKSFTTSDKGMLLCSTPDSEVETRDVNEWKNERENKGPEITSKDVEDLQELGFDVSVTNL